jgi:hypothetical protein
MTKTYLLMFALCMALATRAAPPADSTPAGRAIAPPPHIPYQRAISDGPAGTPVATSAMPRELRRAVVADAAKRFNVPASAVVLTRAERVTWPDASLGCAEPGRRYAQVLVAGFRVIASTSAGELLYHTDSARGLANCALPHGAAER